MDGLSAAASGIAVVSLAIQLVDSVGRIRRFLRSISDAPKELERLIDLLEQLEMILQQILMMVEKQNAGPGNTDLFKNVFRAVKSCEIKLSKFESLIEASKQISFSRKRMMKTVGSFQLACKKKDIQEFESQLNEAMTLLNLALTATLADRKVPFHETQDIVRDSPQSHGQVRRSTLVTNYNTIFRIYSSPFGNLFVRKTSKSQTLSRNVEPSPSRAHNVDESSWVFMPSFISSCINFRYLSTCGTVQRSLRTYPVISEGHPIWKLCKDGNVQGIQELLNGRQVSPFSINMRGKTLLHFAARSSQSDTCRLLLNLGLTGEEVDFYGMPCYRAINRALRSEADIQAFEETYHLFASRINDLNPAIYGPTIFVFYPKGEQSFHLFHKMVSAFVTRESINKFAYSPIAAAMHALWNIHPTNRDRDSWKHIIRRLVNLANREDHPMPGGIFGVTLLDQILYLVDHPFDSIAIGHEFLNILSDLELNIVAYLRAESKHHFNSSEYLFILNISWIYPHPKRYLLITEKPPSASWDWYIDPEGIAFHLLNEFKYLDYMNPSNYFYKGRDTWPILFPDWYQNTREVSPKRQAIRKKHEDRVQHRQHKKAIKLAKIQKILHRPPKIPGAWID
ncbi:hypothetical protein BGZ60DRAFT_527110 [Tricladium varicosporioides]|nr:hypothetical protein BGZ60DRAFT_527110 [Hymenoscyphus varicosporioides]